MATGKATVVTGSGNTVKDAVHQSTGDAVRAAQNAGASKKEVIQARDAAKADTYNKIAANISIGGSGSQRQIAEIQNNPDLIQDIKNSGVTQNIATAISRNHDVRMGVDPALYNAAQQGFQNPKNLKQVAMRQINSKPPSAASDTIAMYGSVRQNKNVDESVQVAKTYVRGGSFLAAPVFGVSMLHPDNPNRLFDVTESWKKLDENIVAGYYGEETADTKKIDDHSNKATDVLDGVTTTLIDPGRLRKSHENPNMLAVDTNEGYGKYADKVVTPLDNFAKSDNIFSRFVRGGTLDNAAGITTLGSEAIKTGSTMIQDAPGALREGGIKGVGQSAADTFASSAGRLLGGTAAALVDDPVAFTGSVVVPGAVKVGGKVGKIKARGLVDTVGTKHAPLESFTDTRLVEKGGDIYKSRGSDSFHTVRDVTVPDVIEMFKKTTDYYPDPTVFDEGKVAGIHSSPSNLGAEFVVEAGTSSEPGMFVADKASPYFLKIPAISITGVGLSNPIKDIKSGVRGASDFFLGKGNRPSFNFLEADSIQQMPKRALKSDKAASDFILKEADPAAFTTTRKMKLLLDQGRYAESEAVAKPGAAYYLNDQSYHSTVKQPIDFFGINLESDVRVPMKHYKQKGSPTKTRSESKRSTRKQSSSQSSSLLDDVHFSQETVPVVNLGYSVKPSPSKAKNKTAKTSPSKYGAQKSYQTTPSNMTAGKTSTYGTNYKSSKTTAHLLGMTDKAAAPQSKTKIKRTRNDDLLPVRKNNSKNKRDYQKELRINIIGDLKL